VADHVGAPQAHRLLLEEELQEPAGEAGDLPSRVEVVAAAPDDVRDLRLAQLLFRRLFQAEMQERGWNTPDILMREIKIELPVQPYTRQYFPVIAAQQTPIR
jgi:hypothetical protein